jgi:uncharacterized protein YciI
MQFLIVLQLMPKYMSKSNWTEETNKILGEHWNYLVGLNEKGVIKLVGRTNYDVDHEDNRGLSVFEAENLEKANEVLNNDPCIVNGVMKGKVHPFTVFMYNGEVLEH